MNHSAPNHVLDLMRNLLYCEKCRRPTVHLIVVRDICCRECIKVLSTIQPARGSAAEAAQREEPLRVA